MHRAHIALQELQAIAMMLHRMAFHLTGKVVALYLDNSTAKVYLCNQGGTMSCFLSRQACHILSLTDKHGITLIPAYIPTHINVDANYLSWDQVLPEWHLLSGLAMAAFHLWGLPEVDLLASSHFTQCQHHHTLESPLSLGALGWNAFHHLLVFQVSYMLPPPALVPLVLSKFLAEHVKGQLIHLILVAPCWMEAPWAPHSSQHVGRHSSAVPYHKRSHHGCLSRPGIQGFAISAFNHLAAQQCVMQRQRFSSSFCQEVVGQLQCLPQRSTSSVGRNGQVGVLYMVYLTMPSLPLN